MNLSKLTGSMGIDLGNVIRTLMGQTCIVEYGIVKDVPAKGIVTVLMSVTQIPGDLHATNCVWAGTATGRLAVYSEPQPGDKVLVLFPRLFDPRMFDLEQDEVLTDTGARGYSLLGGIAVPLTQYRPGQHKNALTLDKDGALALGMHYDDAADKDLVTVSLDKDGNLSAKATTDGTTVLWSVAMDGDGIAVQDNNGNKITMTSSGMEIEDKNGNKITMTDSGMEIEDKNGCTFVTDSTGTTINGNLWVKKPAAST